MYLSGEEPFALGSHTSARQFDGALSILFFSYDRMDARNYKAGINMLNGVTLGAIIGAFHEMVPSIMDNRGCIGMTPFFIGRNYFCVTNFSIW